MKAILAIDGGGTHTGCLAFDRTGRLLGTGSGGPSNHLLAPVDVVARSVTDAIGGALAESGLALADVEAIAAGLAGIDFDGTGAEEADEIFTRAGFPGSLLFGDSVIAHRGALDGAPGVLALAGTGSAFLAIGDDGTMAKCGGWGPLYGDEGSAYWIAVEGLRAVARASDGRSPRTSLTELLLERLGVRDVWGTVQRIYRDGMERHHVAALSEVVNQAAESGDPVAHAILARAAGELAEGAAASAASAGIAPEGCLVSFQGSLLLRCHAVRSEFQRAVQERLPGCCPRDPVHEPVYGAYLLARRAVGWAAEEHR
jgi:N-acetylglucosamine kinase-like BadF-type ATPase